MGRGIPESQSQHSKTSSRQINLEELGPPIPPDGGWGWVVMIASFFVNVLVDGVVFTFSIFYNEFLLYYKESASKTAWVGSLVPGLYLSVGPLVSALANKYGCKRVTMVGSVIASIAFVTSTLSPNVNVLIITYGVMGGIGFGLMYLPCLVIVGMYFVKRRAFASGIAVAGSGIGTLLFAPFAQWLLKLYGWKGANIIIGGLVLNGLVCGMLFRPLEDNPPPKSKKEKMLEEAKPSNILLKIKAEKDRMRTISTGSLDGCMLTKDNTLIKDKDKINEIMKNWTPPKIVNSDPTVEGDSVDNMKSNNAIIVKQDTEGETQVKDHLTSKLNSSVSKPFNKNLARVTMQSPATPRKEKTQSNPVTMSIEDMRHIRHEAARPMYRQDILYTGSIQSIAEYKSTNDVTSYVQSTTSIPDIPDDSDGSKCAPIMNVLKNMFDMQLLKSPTFIILCVCSVFAMLGFFTPFVYIQIRALQLGIPPFMAVTLLSIIGVSNTSGRIIAGWVSDRPWADCVKIHNFALVVAGVVTCCVPFFTTYNLLAAYCACFGLCIACYIALRTIVLVELFGVASLSNATGFILLFQGIAALVGSPLAGAIFDATNSFSLSFVTSGVMIALAGVIVLPIRYINDWENNRKGGRPSVYSKVIDNDIIAEGRENN